MSGEVFAPESLDRMCRHDLSGALSLLADHLDCQEVSGSLWSFQGNGMVQDWRREHFLRTAGRSRPAVRSREVMVWLGDSL